MPRPNRRAHTVALGLSLLLAACSNIPDAGSGENTTPGGNRPPVVSMQTVGGQAVSGVLAVGPAASVRVKLSDGDGDAVSALSWRLMQGGAQVASGAVPQGEIKATLDLNLPTLSAGDYALTVSAVDVRGALGAATIRLIVDAVAPTLTELTVNGSPVQPGANLTQPVGETLTLSAKASDDVSAAPTINVYRGSALIATGRGEVTADLTGSAPTTAGYTVVTVDSVGNSVTQALSVAYTADSTVTPAPSPKIVINNTGAQPYSNILSITASAGVAAGVGTKQLILEVTDAKGIVDTTTYSTTSETASFNIDTTKYPDGALTLRAIAVDAKDQRGTSTPTVVQIANAVAPTITIISPTNGAQVSGPTQVTVQVRQNNTAFTFANNTMLLEVVDSRGQVVTTQTATFAPVNQGLWQATASVDFNATQYLNADYTLRASTRLTLAGEAAARTVTAASSVSNRSKVAEPPALNILSPAFFNPLDSNNPDPALRPILTRKSAVLVQVSDSDEIVQVQLQFVCNPEEINTGIGQTCNTTAYNFNLPIGDSGLFYKLFNTGVLIDGQPFVPNGYYLMRAVATDAAGNSNIKEMRISVDRSKAGIANLGTNTAVTFESNTSRYTPASAVWTVGGNSANKSRAISLFYRTQSRETPNLVSVNTEAPVASTFSTGYSFIEAGVYANSFLIQDFTTGVVEYYDGRDIFVTSK